MVLVGVRVEKGIRKKLPEMCRVGIIVLSQRITRVTETESVHPLPPQAS